MAIIFLLFLLPNCLAKLLIVAWGATKSVLKQEYCLRLRGGEERRAKGMLEKESFELRVIRFHASITRVCALVRRIFWSILE